MLLVVGFAGAATAVDLNPLPCGDPDIPVASLPGDGLAASLDGGPASIKDGDPFAPGSTVSIYEVHGYGPGLHSYVFQCDLGVDVTTPLSSLLYSLTKIMVAAVVFLARVIFDPEFMALLTPVFDVATRAFGNGFFIPLIGIAVLGTAVWMATRSRRRVTENADAAAGVLVVVMIAMAAILYPFTLGATVDKAMTAVVATASDAINRTAGERDVADALGTTLTESLVYQTWVTANFGRGNSKAAREYGPALWNASTLTRAEEAAIAEDPSRAEAIFTRKKDSAEQIVEKVKDDYPSSYSYLAGEQGGARVGYTFLGWFAAVSSLLMLGYALYRVVWALVFVRLTVAVTPLVAIAAQHPRWRWMMLGLLNSAGGLLVSGAAFAVISVVLVGAGYAALLSVESGLPSPVAVLAIGALNLAVWRLTTTLRRGGPLGQLRDATKGKLPGRDALPRIPDLFPADKLPDPHPRHTPSTTTAAPAESSMASTVIKGAFIAGVGAATGGAGAAAATKVAASTAASQTVHHLTATLTTPPAKTGRVIYTPTTPPQPPPAGPRPAVIQGTVIPPETSTRPTAVQETAVPPEAAHATTRLAYARQPKWETNLYTPEARPVSPDPAPARRTLPATPVTDGDVRLYTIGERP
ncbi:MAG: hypothetical protein ACRCY8_09910 [Dermatophilaceae bacterium]